MSDKYCCNCNRMVGTKKNVTPGLIAIAIGVVLAMFIPFLGWLLGFVLVIAGITMIICSGKKCPICGSTRLLDSPPATASGHPAQSLSEQKAEQKNSDVEGEDSKVQEKNLA